MPATSDRRGSNINIRPDRVGTAPKVNLAPIADLAATYINDEFASQRQDLLVEAQQQVANAAIENPTGFLESPKPVKNNIFNSEIINQVRIENVLRGRNALSLYEAGATETLGDVYNPDSMDVADNTTMDGALQRFDDSWNNEIVPNISDPESLTTLTKDYLLTRQKLALKIQAGKEKAARLRRVETAEQRLDFLLADPSVEKLSDIGDAFVLATANNPKKQSEYAEQVRGAFAAIVKPDNMKSFIREQWYTISANEQNTDKIVSKIWTEGTRQMSAILQFLEKNKNLVPESYVKNYQDSFTNALYDTAVDVQIIPSLEVSAQNAIAAGKGKDFITIIKANYQDEISKLAKGIEKETRGTVTAAEFKRQMIPRIEAGIGHLDTLASLNDKNQADQQDQMFKVAKGAATSYTRGLKEGDIFADGSNPVWMNNDEARSLLSYDENGHISLTQEEKDALYLNTQFVTQAQRDGLDERIDRVLNNNADDISSFDLATEIVSEFSGMKDEQKVRVRRGLELRITGMKNKRRANPEKERITSRFNADKKDFQWVDFTSPVYVADDNSTYEEIAKANGMTIDELQKRQEDNFADWLVNYRERRQAVLPTDRTGAITPKERQALRRELVILQGRDRDDKSGLQKQITEVLRNEGDVWSILVSNDENFQRRNNIPATPQIRHEVSQAIDNLAGIDVDQATMLESIVPNLVANAMGNYTDNDGNISNEGRSSVIRRILNQSLLQIGGSKVIAPFVSYQADALQYDRTGSFFGFDGHDLFDNRQSGVLRQETDAGYFLTLMEQSATVEVDPTKGEARPASKIERSEMVDALIKVQTGQYVMRNMPLDAEGNFRFIIMDATTGRRVGTNAGKGRDTLIITLPRVAAQQESPYYVGKTRGKQPPAVPTVDEDYGGV